MFQRNCIFRITNANLVHPHCKCGRVGGKETKQAYLLVTDVTGKVLQRIALQPERYSYTLEISNFAKGYYHVCLYEDGFQSDCKKLIKN